MDKQNLYSQLRWHAVAARARSRDGNRCTVSRLLGGECTGRLHVHHIVAVSEGGALYDLENLGTACAAHHPLWESLRRVLVRKLTAEPPRCPHHHASADARRLCEARLARRARTSVAA
jgi:hypothetical protein